jgi:anti-anti-sigma factor
VVATGDAGRPRSHTAREFEGIATVLRTIDIRQIRGQEAGTVRVLLSGELDIATTQRLWRWLDGLIAHEDDIVVDLRDVASIDVSCTRVLVRAAARARVAGLSFGITDPGPAVTRMLELTSSLDVLRPRVAAA